LAWLPYNVVKGKGGKPYVKTQVTGGVTKELSPEEISSMILIKM
jgi:molecular chaperone DnaK (HSP70)